MDGQGFSSQGDTWHRETRHRNNTIGKGLFKEKPPGGVVLSGLLSPLCCVQGLEAQRRSPANGLTGLPRSMRKAMLGHRGAESCLVCEN